MIKRKIFKVSMPFVLFTNCDKTLEKCHISHVIVNISQIYLKRFSKRNISISLKYFFRKQFYF